MSVYKDLYVRGNLSVTGRSTTISSSNMLVADPFMLINANESSVQTYTGGIAINYDVLGSVSATAFNSGTSTITCGDLTSIVADGNSDFVLVAGSSHNNGIYEVLTRTATTIVIDTTTPTATNIALKSLVTEINSASTISAVSIMLIQSNGAGNLQVGKGSDGTTLDNSFLDVGLQGGDAAFDSISLTDDANQIILNSDGTSGTINLASQSGNSIYTIPDVGTGDFVMTTGVQTITGVKTLTTPVITGVLSLDDSDSINNLNLISTSTLTTNRLLTVDVNDADRTLALGGNMTIANDFITSGNFSLTLTQTGTTDVTVPTTGTLATLAGAETLSNKTIIASSTSVSSNYTALLSDNMIICTTAGTDVTITLPVVGVATGIDYSIILDTKGVGNLIVEPDGTDKMEGVSSETITLDVVNQTLKLISDGTSWRIV